LEDIGLLVLDAPSTTYTHAVITQVLASGAAILPCAGDHHPCGLFLPQNNSLQTARINQQAAASTSLRKRLWKQIVQCKIRNQAHAIAADHPSRVALLQMIPRVRSGDVTNVEAHAARRYWPVMFGKDFRRARDGDPPNGLLNYGYMVMRASIARAICGAGLHPSLGLHHHNRSNPFCLPDDLLEPFRPVVDRKVKELWESGVSGVDRATKIDLLGLLTEQVELGGGGQSGPFMVALERLTASLVRCFAGDQKELDLPKLCN
jgi:CRISPR-associated protein Cas1